MNKQDKNQELKKKPLNATEKKVLELYNNGMTVQNDIRNTIGVHSSTVSRALAHIRKDYPESLVTQNTLQATQKPQTAPELSQLIKNTPKEEKPNIKPQKAVMGFRAETDKIGLWKIYADVTGQEIGILCTAALDEYISNHRLTADQQKLFELKREMLEAEKRIKSGV